MMMFLAESRSVFAYRVLWVGVRGGASGELMAPRVSWRWKRGRHLCGAVSQFSIASGNWQIVMMGLVGRGLEEDQVAWGLRAASASCSSRSDCGAVSGGALRMKG